MSLIGLLPPPPHFTPCTADVDPEVVAKSQKEFPWRVVDLNDDREWVSWPAFGLNVKVRSSRVGQLAHL